VTTWPSAATRKLSFALRPADLRRFLGLVGDDGEQPGPERGARPETVEGAVRFDEGLLGGVFRLGGIARYEVGRAEGHRLVYAHQPFVGGCISRTCPLGELRFLQGGGLTSSTRLFTAVSPQPSAFCSC
jgi:hypothetical protein